MMTRMMTRTSLSMGLVLLATTLASNASLANGRTVSSTVEQVAPVTLAKAPKRRAAKSTKAAEEAERKKAEEEAAKKAAEEEAAQINAEKEAAEKKAAEEAAAAEAAAAAKADAEKSARAADEARRTALEGAGLDARVRFLTDSVARTLKRLPGDYRDQTYSVLPFEETGEETQSRQLGKVVSDLVITNLSRDHRLELTERSQLSAIGAEQALGQLGALDDGQAVSIGKIAAARAIIVGSVADTGEAFVVTTRVLDTETAKVLSAESVNLPKEELIAFSANAVVLRSRSGAAFRSAVAPGWGQAYNNDPFKAVLVGGGVGALALSAAAIAGFGALNAYSYDCWKQCGAPFPLDPSAIKTADDQANLLRGMRETANGAYATSLVVVGLAAAVWGVGIADAYFSGVDVDSLDEAMTDY